MKIFRNVNELYTLYGRKEVELQKLRGFLEGASILNYTIHDVVLCITDKKAIGGN